jgi:hypothetical protein
METWSVMDTGGGTPLAFRLLVMGRARAVTDWALMVPSDRELGC